MIYPQSVQSNEDVARHYDGLDTFYREVWSDHLHHGYWECGDETVEEAVTALVDLVASRAALTAGARVCDVGCGYGAAASYLASRYDADVTGITLSELQYRYAVERNGSASCRFLLGDWLDNDLPEWSFHTVTAIECLSHMTDKARFFEEAYRVLAPGGRVVICVWLAGSTASEHERRWLLEPICREGRLASLADAGEVRQLARDAGFENVESMLLTRRVRRTWNVCARRLLGRIVTNRRYQRFLMNSGNEDRTFLRAIPRIMIAYRTGAMEYGLFTARKAP